MIFTQNAEQWLQQVDPWSSREARDLLQALEQGRSVGVFDCASTADGSRWFLMAPHAEQVLLLPSPDAWQALIAEVACRYGLNRTVPSAIEVGGVVAADGTSDRKARNDSRIMPLSNIA